MARAKPIFELQQRIDVPGISGVQGIITTIVQGIGQQPVYAVSYITAAGLSSSISMTESDLLLANPG